MTTWEHIDHVLHAELLQLSGVPVTLASLLTCIFIFLIGLLIARIARAAVVRVVLSRGRAPGAASAVGKIVWYAHVAIALFVALDTLGFNLTAVLAGSAIILVGIGFGLQNIAQNFISGLILLMEHPVKEGDFIQVGEIFGEVKQIGLRATRVISRDQVTVIVPNSELATTQVVNYSVPTENTRITVTVGVAYGSDTSAIQEILLRVAAAEPEVLRSPPPEVRFDDFGESSLDFALLCWIAVPREDVRIKSRLRFAIDREFRAADVTIPFPQRDLHLKSGLESLQPARPDRGPLRRHRSWIAAGTQSPRSPGGPGGAAG